MKALRLETSTRGIRFAITPDRAAADRFMVWKECSNYDGHSRGGIRKTWRFVQRGLTRDVADKLFDRRVGKKS